MPTTEFFFEKGVIRAGSNKPSSSIVLGICKKPFPIKGSYTLSLSPGLTIVYISRETLGGKAKAAFQTFLKSSGTISLSNTCDKIDKRVRELSKSALSQYLIAIEKGSEARSSGLRKGR